MLTSGDTVGLDLGQPARREAGFGHRAVVVTAQRVLGAGPTVVQVVPLTATVRGFGSEVLIEPDDSNGLEHSSVAQSQHVRAISTERIDRVQGNVGPVALAQIRDVIGLILDIPTSRYLSPTRSCDDQRE